MAISSASERKAAIQRATQWFCNKAEPTWEIAALYPAQGTWSEDEYLSIHSNRRIEFDNGRLEFLPVRIIPHEDLMIWLFDLLRAFVRARKLGRVYCAGVRVYTTPTKYRVPDAVLVTPETQRVGEDKAFRGAELVMEVVSKDDPDRDWIKKRREYARAGIREYWVVDPQKREIAVFMLKGARYEVHGRFKPGEIADSALLKGFEIDVREAFFGKKD